LDTLVWIKNETHIWLEITTLLIPGENDSNDEISQMCEWILENLGESVPLHFTAFHPDFKMIEKPRTPISTLQSARKIALKSGLLYCYIGNVYDQEGQTTYCPNCKKTLIIRDWHSVIDINLRNDSCPFCGYKIAGIFN